MPSPSPWPAAALHRGRATRHLPDRGAGIPACPHQCASHCRNRCDAAGRIAAERHYWMLTCHRLDPLHAPLADGTDPADLLALKGPTALTRALAAAEPLAERLLEVRLANLPPAHHVLAADEVRGNQRERLQSPGHEPTQRDDYSTSTPLPDQRLGPTSGVVRPLPRYPGTAADRRPAPAGLLAASDRRRTGPASIDDQTRAGSAPIP